MSPFSYLPCLLYVLFGAFTLSAAEPLAGTTTYEPPVALNSEQVTTDFGKHAVTRLVDWNADNKLDILIGAGDGHIWLMLNTGKATFAAPIQVIVNIAPLRVGTQATTACFVDMNGDSLHDLVIAHSDNQITAYLNEGTAAEPKFKISQSLLDNDNKPLTLNKSCGGRIDALDWDRDGDTDIIAGTFSGPITCYENCGTSKVAKFSHGIPLSIGYSEKNYSYNVHPTLYDLNQDSHVDIAYGMNWGTMGFLMRKPQANKKAKLLVSTEVTPVFSTGKSIDLRAIAGDDATPTFGDLDGDGTLDMVTGGRNGKIFWLRGVPVAALLERIASIMSQHANDLGTTLQKQEALRTELMGLHAGIYRLCQGFLNTPQSRQAIRTWYVEHIQEYGKWLRHGHHDEKVAPYIPSLAYQTWTLLMLLHDGDPDAISHRQFVADTIGFQGRLENILVEFGTLIIENGRATPNQQETLYSYLSQIPKPLLGDRSVNAITEVITIGEYLGPRLDVLHAGGVNIFASESGKLKSSENPFPKDFLRCENDYFGVVLAHELNHRVDATRFVAVPKYNQRYWKHMQKITGSNVKFNAPHGIGVDWKATKQHFKQTDLWNGNEKEWNTAWANYWLTGPGKSQTLNVCRNETTYTPPRFGIPFFLETRQEAIASLANQYFTDSEHMLEFALDRYKRGASGCLDEWLLMADVYSLDTNRTYLYRHANGNVQLDRTEATLTRNAAGYIDTLTFKNRKFTFTLDEHGLVNNVMIGSIDNAAGD